MTPNRPLRLFISYSRRDERYRRELETHLSLLKRQGILEVWSDRQIEAGRDWAANIRRNLETADLILLLISPDFLASDFIHDQELTRAMVRHEAGQARIIPVFLRACDWKGAVFGQLQGVPDEAKPIAQWKDRDDAFARVAQAIRTAASLPPRAPPAGSPAPAARRDGRRARTLGTGVRLGWLGAGLAGLVVLALGAWVVFATLHPPSPPERPVTHIQADHGVAAGGHITGSTIRIDGQPEEPTAPAEPAARR